MGYVPFGVLKHGWLADPRTICGGFSSKPCLRTRKGNIGGKIPPGLESSWPTVDGVFLCIFHGSVDESLVLLGKMWSCWDQRYLFKKLNIYRSTQGRTWKAYVPFFSSHLRRSPDLAFEENAMKHLRLQHGFLRRKAATHRRYASPLHCHGLTRSDMCPLGVISSMACGWKNPSLMICPANETSIDSGFAHILPRVSHSNLDVRDAQILKSSKLKTTGRNKRWVVIENRAVATETRPFVALLLAVCCGKSPFSCMDVNEWKSLAIFHSYVKLPEVSRGCLF